MAKATDGALRRVLVAEHAQGQSLRTLAQAYGVSYSTVQRLCARYAQAGESGLVARYAACGKVRPDGRQVVYRAVRCLRTWHPRWGAEKIRQEIRLRRPNWEVPPARTLQQWFHYMGLIPARDQAPRQVRPWAQNVHEGWQMDAKEELRTADGQLNCWLNLVDERSGAVIDPPVFPL